MMNLTEILQKRKANTHRHPQTEWSKIETILNQDSAVFKAVLWMEETGGEPDVYNLKDNTFCFIDSVKESPLYRRSLCYDKTENKTNP